MHRLISGNQVGCVLNACFISKIKRRPSYRRVLRRPIHSFQRNSVRLLIPCLRRLLRLRLCLRIWRHNLQRGHCQEGVFIVGKENKRFDKPRTLFSQFFGSRMINAAASPFSGSAGLGYRNNCGRKTSKMLIMSYMGDQVWLMTSRQTDPELYGRKKNPGQLHIFFQLKQRNAYSSSIFGWKIRLTKPILGLLYGY